LDLKPLPLSALGNKMYEDLYRFSHFNPIQTQVHFGIQLSFICSLYVFCVLGIVITFIIVFVLFICIYCDVINAVDSLLIISLLHVHH
jgi:hypothetical protein